MPVKDNSVIRADIVSKIEDNQQGRVSPEDIRSILLDMLDSSHVLSADKNLVAGNLSSIDTGNTYFGEETVSTNDVFYNTAIGYFALRANDADKNTAMGAYAASCNVYGSGNTAFGFGALASNFSGSNNVAIGKNALKRNKHGNFNIGIGNGAGYYIDENDSYKFYLASHDIDESGMCNYPDGLNSMAPLLYGDLLNSRLVVGSDLMHSQGALQVNGNVTPASSSGQSNLGTYAYPWNKVYTKALDSSEEQIESYRDVVPHQPSVFNLGSEDKPWNHFYVDNLHVNSLADITHLNYVTIDQSQFYDKQIFLASSGVDSNNNATPYLTDEGIDGAGFVVKSSGTNYLRSYSFTYKAPDLDWECMEVQNAYTRSAWLSNISIEIMDGRLLKTQRVMSPDSLALVGQGCYGMFIDQGIIIGTDGDRANFQDDYYQPDFISFAGGNYASFTTSRQSGIFIEDNLLSQYDGTSNLVGFKRRYVDSDQSRFIVSSHVNGQTPVSQFVAMRDRAAFGFTDKTTFIPETLLNTFSSGDAIFRHTGEHSSRIQLSSPDNLFNSGVELYYSSDDSKFRIVTKEGSSLFVPVTISGDVVGINETSPFSSLTVGRDGNGNAAISLKESVGAITDVDGYGSLYIKAISNPDMPNSVFYRNENGDEFNLLLSSGDKMGSEYVYSDEYANTFVGFESIFDRSAPTTSGYLERNTTLGHQALLDLAYGDDNVAIGAYAGKGVVFGNNNMYIGVRAGEIGDDLGQTLNNQFRLGNNGLLMSGTMPSNSTLAEVYFNNKFGLFSGSGNKTLSVYNDGSDTVFDKHTSGNIHFTFFDTHDPFYITESGIVVSRVEFEDGTYFDTASGVKFVEGTAITFTPSGDRRSINVDIEKLDSTDDMYHDSYVMISNSGENFKSSILNIARFVNPDNPEMFFDCGGGYNILISRNSDVSNSLNCNNLVGGWKAGDEMTGFTNSLILGSKAGQDATMQNPDLSIDTAAIFLGYNAGRLSRNADNSIFIGPSAGQNSIFCDNSIFIGNSAGQGSASSKSIAIGDNTLVEVDGENNLEIIADIRSNNRLINGTMSNKFNIQGVIAGDHCSGRVSVGGSARVYPNAVLEVAAGFGDNQTRLQEWYNGLGRLVGYLDQAGNLILAGSIVENYSYIGENNRVSAVQPTPDVCGNTNAGGSVPRPGENTNDGDGGVIVGRDTPTTSYAMTISDANVSVGESTVITLTRFGGTLGTLTFTLSTTGGVSAPSTIIIPDGINSNLFSVSANSNGIGRVTANHTTLGSKFIDINVSDPSVVSPSFTSSPVISPSSGEVNSTFTATNGTVINGTVTSRVWRLNGTTIASNTNTVTPSSAGTLTFTVTATGNGQNVSATANATVTSIPVIATYTASPNPATVTLNGSVTITVTRNGSTSSSATVPLYHSGNVSCTPGTLSFGVGETTKTFLLNGLSLTNSDEVWLNNDPNQSLEFSVIASNIQLTLSTANPVIVQGQNRSITISRTGGNISQPLNVWYEGYFNGVFYEGYEDWPDNFRTIPANQSSITYTDSNWGVGSNYFLFKHMNIAESNNISIYTAPKRWELGSGSTGNNTTINSSSPGSDIFVNCHRMLNYNTSSSQYIANTANLNLVTSDKLVCLFNLPGLTLDRDISKIIIDIVGSLSNTTMYFGWDVYQNYENDTDLDIIYSKIIGNNIVDGMSLANITVSSGINEIPMSTGGGSNSLSGDKILVVVFDTNNKAIGCSQLNKPVFRTTF